MQRGARGILGRALHHAPDKPLAPLRSLMPASGQRARAGGEPSLLPLDLDALVGEHDDVAAALTASTRASIQIAQAGDAGVG